MQLSFIDTNKAVLDALSKYFPEAKLYHEPLDHSHLQEHDAFITAGNSFGLMDGGIDLAVAQALPAAEGFVQQAIVQHHHGLLPVGHSIGVPVATSAEKDVLLVYAPTMRIPADIRATDNVFYAFRSALQTIREYQRATLDHRRIFGFKVLCPGMGTSAGRMHPEQAAYQMSLAWNNLNMPVPTPNWATARSTNALLLAAAQQG